MNVKIPYNFFKNFENLDFVSFILDKNNSSVFRLDLKPDTYADFFLKKQKYIIAPKKEYHDCDTIIFFPHYKNSGWGSKIVLRKGATKFVNVNGSIHLLKNEKVDGNVTTVKNCLYEGAKLNPDTKIIGTKNLIYFTFFGDKKYSKLLDLLLQTLKKQNYQNFDLLFIAEKDTAKEINKLKSLEGFNVDYFILPKTKDPVEASMRKLKIYDYKKIDQYKNILFLDLDIIVIGNLSKIFEERTIPNIFYSGTQRCSHDLHKSVYHRLIEYNNEELERFAKNDTFAFNAGQFFFKNTSTMRKHFENINKMANNWEGEYFFEQSFLNCYFNVLGLSNVFKFKEQFRFVAINEGEMNNVFNSEAVFAHFMGSAADASDKFFFIKKYYKHLL